MATYSRTIRQGLPRRSGGEAWPPGQHLSANQPETGLSVSVAVEIPPSVALESADRTAEDAAPAALAREADGERWMRRGLPRTSGGAPWPPLTPRPRESSDSSIAPVAVNDPEVPQHLELEHEQRSAATINSPTSTTPTEQKRVAPFTRVQWRRTVIVAGVGVLVVAALIVLAVQWLLSLPFMKDFLVTYPGEYELPNGAPEGTPAWLGWQHFFNVFLVLLIIRSGLQVRREKRPRVSWSPRNKPGRKISLALWFHQSLDILWLVNGLVFVVLLFVTGQWLKIVPTSWDVFPNALSAGLQYASLHWPTENGWVNYNSLQQLAYFVTVFIAAPLAAITGVRMSGIWPKNATTLSKIYPVEWARAVHFPVMIFFVVFIFVHVLLVFSTGALRNLNHMYASQDAVSWVGFGVFAASLVAIASGWVAARPLVLSPIAQLFGTLSRG